MDTHLCKGVQCMRAHGYTPVQGCTVYAGPMDTHLCKGVQCMQGPWIHTCAIVMWHKKYTVQYHKGHQ